MVVPLINPIYIYTLDGRYFLGISPFSRTSTGVAKTHLGARHPKGTIFQQVDYLEMWKKLLLMVQKSGEKTTWDVFSNLVNNRICLPYQRKDHVE